jgi:hypothetical protein
MIENNTKHIVQSIEWVKPRKRLFKNTCILKQTKPIDVGLLVDTHNRRTCNVILANVIRVKEFEMTNTVNAGEVDVVIKCKVKATDLYFEEGSRRKMCYDRK